MPVSAAIEVADIVYKLTPKALLLGIKGENPVIDGLMNYAVKPDDSLRDIETVTTIDGKRFVKVKIQKAEKCQNWIYLVKSLKSCRNCGLVEFRMSRCQVCLDQFQMKWQASNSYFT